MEGRRHRPRSASGRSMRSSGEVGSGMGRGTNLEHDRHPARLVHFSPAHLGRADCGCFCVRNATNRSMIRQSTAALWSFRERGSGRWYIHEAADLLPAGTACPDCGGTVFEKEMDILDVWFESGASWHAVMEADPELSWPADLYTEGGDQHRGWFHSSLLTSVAVKGKAPYRMVATSGWTLDEQGRPLSKSLGNGVDPVDIAETAWRRGCSLVGGVGGLPRRRGRQRKPDAARGRQLPQEPQHFPLPAGRV